MMRWLGCEGRGEAVGIGCMLDVDIFANSDGRSFFCSMILPVKVYDP